MLLNDVFFNFPFRKEQSYESKLKAMQQAMLWDWAIKRRYKTKLLELEKARLAAELRIIIRPRIVGNFVSCWKQHVWWSTGFFTVQYSSLSLFINRFSIGMMPQFKQHLTKWGLASSNVVSAKDFWSYEHCKFWQQNVSWSELVRCWFPNIRDYGIVNLNRSISDEAPKWAGSITFGIGADWSNSKVMTRVDESWP